MSIFRTQQLSFTAFAASRKASTDKLNRQLSDFADFAAASVD